MFLAAVMLLQAAPQCTATDAALPANLSGWTASSTELCLGAALRIPTRHFVTNPDFPGVEKGSGVTQSFRIETSGRYGIALDRRGWIDVSAAPTSGVAEGSPLKSVAHGHGPECSTIRKLVWFDLKPGEYVLHLKGLEEPAATVMLVAS